MEVNSQELIQTLQNKITLFRHLGITVKEMTGDRVHFHVDLQKNLNHKGTAFGGSLYATAVLAAYGLVLAGLKEKNITTENIVIAKGAIEYLRPVQTNFEIICEFSDPSVKDQFYSDLIANKRVRGAVKSQIFADGGSLKAEFEGSFVVKL